MRRVGLVLALSIAFGCDSTALNLDFPETSAVEVTPQFMQADTRDVSYAFVGFDVDDAAGDPQTWSVVDWDFGDDGPVLDVWEFESNFSLRLRLSNLGAAEGEHGLTLTIRNHYGTFTGTGRFFVFWLIPACLITLLAAVSPATERAEAALDAATRCYEELDYACAETRLAEALAGALTLKSLKRARLQEALLALAHRDDARARRAVQALLALEPGFDPGPVPPPLRALFAEERATLPPPPSFYARADLTNIRVFGSDADRWSEGLGVELGGGVLYLGEWSFELAAGFSDHRPRTLLDDALSLWTLAASASWSPQVGPLRLHIGAQIGTARVDIDSRVLPDDGYWGGLLQIPVEVSWQFAWGLGLGARVAPGLFFTQEADRAAGSLVVPLLVGLRYGR